MKLDELLKQVKAQSGGGKPTRRQVDGALQVLSEGVWGHSLSDMGIPESVHKAVRHPDVKLVARIILTCAIFGDSIPDRAFADDDE